MRYVIADLDGRTHAYFDLRGQARAALREIQDEDPEMIDELYVVAYDGGRRVRAPEPAAVVLDSRDLDWTHDPTAVASVKTSALGQTFQSVSRIARGVSAG